MARAPNNHELSPTEDGFSEKRLEEAGQAAQIISQMNPMMDAVLETGVDIGRIQAFEFIATIANSAAIAVYEKVKKSKAWAYLPNPKNCDASPFTSLDEFCEVKLGKSYRRMQELTANRNTLGQEAFEQAEKLGMRQIDYNAIKALPAPKQEIIKEALSEGADLETVTRALRQLAAEDQREIEHLTHEKDALTKKNSELVANLATKERQLADKNTKLDELDAKLSGRPMPTRNEFGDVIPTATPEETAIELREEATQEAFSVEAAIMGSLRPIIGSLIEHGRANNQSHEDFIVGLLCQIETSISALRGQFLLKDKPDGEDLPEWLRPVVTGGGDA